MDMRARLLIAFTPLLVLLLGTAIALPIIERDTRAFVIQQNQVTANLTSLQEFEVYLVIEHSAVVRLIENEQAEEAQALFGRARSGAEATLAHRAAEGLTSSREVEWRAAYTELQARHAAILAYFAEGDLDAADDLLDEEQTEELVDRILELSAADRAELRGELESTTAALSTNLNLALQRIALATFFGIGLALLLAWVLVGSVVRPLNQLTADAERLAADPLSGELSQAGGVRQVQRLRDAFQRLLDTNRGRELHLKTTLSERETQMAHEAQLRATVAALSVPTIPLGAGMLLLPLMGYLDPQRASAMTQEVLDRVQQERTRTLVIDLTGLPEVTAETVVQLRRIIEAARLLGAQVILVGVRAEHAAPLAAGNLRSSGARIARDIPTVLAELAG